MDSSISESGHIQYCTRSFNQITNHRMANRVDQVENEPSHLDLHSLQRYMNWSAEMKYRQDM